MVFVAAKVIPWNLLVSAIGIVAVADIVIVIPTLTNNNHKDRGHLHQLPHIMLFEILNIILTANEYNDRLWTHANPPSQSIINN